MNAIENKKMKNIKKKMQTVKEFSSNYAKATALIGFGVASVPHIIPPAAKYFAYNLVPEIVNALMNVDSKRHHDAGENGAALGAISGLCLGPIGAYYSLELYKEYPPLVPIFFATNIGSAAYLGIKAMRKRMKKRHRNSQRLEDKLNENEL